MIVVLEWWLQLQRTRTNFNVSSEEFSDTLHVFVLIFRSLRHTHTILFSATSDNFLINLILSKTIYL